MSDTVPPVVPPVVPPNLTPEQLRLLVNAAVEEYKKVDATPNADKVVAAAKDVPDLIMKASAADPELAQQWTGKALLASRTFYGSIGVIIVSALVKRYSLGWDPNTVDTVVGLLDIAAIALLRNMTKYPITGFFKAATPAQAAAKAATTPT